VLIVARVSGLAWTAPAWGSPGLGWRLRVALAVLLTAAVIPAVEPTLEIPEGAAALARACLVEGVIGAALGGAAALVVAGARQAGEIVGAQAGLSPAALLDPEAVEGMTALGHLYGLVALGTFLALDGPLALVGALVESYRVLPTGGVALTAEAADWAFAQVGGALALALRAAAPAALAMTLAGVALGLLGRAAPGLQLMTLALPVRAAVGLVLVLIGFATLAATLAGVWGGLPLLGPILATPRP
jgi:flagellar biosynthesis protein FliR